MCSLMKEVFRRTVLCDSGVKQLLQAQQLRNTLERGFFVAVEVRARAHVPLGFVGFD